jgi:hypothetical protein
MRHLLLTPDHVLLGYLLTQPINLLAAQVQVVLQLPDLGVGVLEGSLSRRHAILLAAMEARPLGAVTAAPQFGSFLPGIGCLLAQIDQLQLRNLRFTAQRANFLQ